MSLKVLFELQTDCTLVFCKIGGIRLGKRLCVWRGHSGRDGVARTVSGQRTEHGIASEEKKLVPEESYLKRKVKGNSQVCLRW
jgi:hypothetical protein